MKIAIMQPYFLPYLGYFSLIKFADKWIVFDTAQFIYHGWIERNRVLRQTGGWHYIKVPLCKHRQTTPIVNIRIRQNESWQDKIMAQLQHYSKAPYYRIVKKFLEENLYVRTDSIVQLNVHLLRAVCDYLGISFDCEILSEKKLNMGVVRADEWALEICKAYGYRHYVNMANGTKFIDTKKYIENGINFTFLENQLPVYDQKRECFEAGLSIVDVMMFNDVDRINSMLDAVVLQTEQAKEPVS